MGEPRKCKLNKAAIFFIYQKDWAVWKVKKRLAETWQTFGLPIIRLRKDLSVNPWRCEL